MKNKIRKSLKFSFVDGVFFSIMFGFGESYINPYAIALKATNMQIGLLSSLPGLIAALLQVRIPDWTEKFGRARIMNLGVFLHASIWVPIILIPFIFPANPVNWLILAVIIYSASVSIATPAWGSIISQYLPANKRGKYFSWRQKINGLIILSSTFIAGLILHLYPRTSLQGFLVIFTIALIARYVSWFFLTKMHEPTLTVKPQSLFTLWEFISRSHKSNFAKFTFFTACISFAVNFSGPFFSVYMLRELKFDYLSFVIINATMILASLVSLPAWGKHIDRVGCLRVIKLTSLIIPILPVLWLVSPSKIYLIIIQIISGFAWGGFNLAASNFIYDAVSEAKRVRCISYFNMINGLGLFLGATLGGYLIAKMPAICGSRILTIFLLSGIIRTLVRIIFISKLHEVRKIKDISNAELFFSVTGLKSSPGTAPES